MVAQANNTGTSKNTTNEKNNNDISTPFDVMIHVTDTNCYIWLNIIWCDLFLMKNSWIL